MRLERKREKEGEGVGWGVGSQCAQKRSCLFIFMNSQCLPSCEIMGHSDTTWSAEAAFQMDLLFRTAEPGEC